MDEKLRITVGGADSFRDSLATGWGLGDVEAASIVRQGHAPSLASAMLGVGVFKLLAPRPAKDLPRKFVLAATPSRVVAFDASSYGEGERSNQKMHVTIEPGAIAEWPRSEVRMRAEQGGMNKSATLLLAGREVPCTVPDSEAEPAFLDLIAKLSGPEG